MSDGAAGDELRLPAAGLPGVAISPPYSPMMARAYEVRAAAMRATGRGGESPGALVDRTRDRFETGHRVAAVVGGHGDVERAAGTRDVAADDRGIGRRLARLPQVSTTALSFDGADLLCAQVVAPARRLGFHPVRRARASIETRGGTQRQLEVVQHDGAVPRAWAWRGERAITWSSSARAAAL